MRTPLFDRHLTLDAKIGDFSGWEMPIFYSGIVAEHFAVRRAVGLFDVSHMGYLEVRGEDAEPFLDVVSTNVVTDRADSSAFYTVFCSESGGCVDDAIIFRRRANQFFVVVSAANRLSDLAHLSHVARSYQVDIEPHFDTHMILALQGPAARGLMADVLGQEIPLKAMQFTSRPFAGEELMISRTGYTGSFGYELIGETSCILKLWEVLLDLGKEHGLLPAGLGARDTLRLEAGYALFGHELAPDIAPIETVSEWTVRWKKRQFIGKEALLHLESSHKKRFQHAVALLGKGVPRQGNAVLKGGRVIGKVTSGTFSPSLDRGIAIVMVSDNLAIGEKIELEIRKQRIPVEVVKLPFYKG